MTPRVLIAVAARGLALPVIQRGSRRSYPTRIVWHVAQRSEPAGHITSVTREARFDALFEEHYRAVARFVRTRGHGPGDADDLIAGTFEVAWRQMDKVPEGREALPWLLGVARNLSRNARRKSRREASFVNELSTVTVPWAEMPIEDRAASADVMGALARLKPVDRDLILLVAWDELTPSEAGQVLALRPVTARSRLHRARQRLSALLAESTASASGTPPMSSPTSEPNQEENGER
jgi:RNA polymerase sigma-70 factor, ECF subfamily